MTAGPVRRTVVVGGDHVAAICALALKRALDPIGVEVVLVRTPNNRMAAEVCATLPGVANLHRLIGLRDKAVYGLCQAVPVMGREFDGWSEKPFLLGYDAFQPAINDVDFIQFWSAARHKGLDVPLEYFSPGAVAARQGKIGQGEKEGRWRRPLSGLHVDAAAYASLLWEGCRKAGVEIIETNALKVVQGRSGIASLALAPDRQVVADLYVDATGSERRLIGHFGFEKWRAWFPSDIRFSASLSAPSPPPAYSRFVAVEDGWIGLLPLQDRLVAIGHLRARDRDVYALVRHYLVQISGQEPATLEWREFAPGRLAHSWRGNVVAMGDSAVCLEQLAPAELQLVQIALSTLVAFWPVDSDAMPEARAFNAAFEEHLFQVRDFQLAHFTRSTRAGDYWESVRAAPVPGSLAHRQQLFAARGVVPVTGEHSFGPGDWSAVLAGTGIVPAHSDPATNRTSESEQIEKFQHLLKLVASEVRSMPTMSEFLVRTGGTR